MQVSAQELHQLEPRLGPGALGGLWVPDESIICPWTTPLAFATEAVLGGVDLLLGRRVEGVEAADGAHVLRTSAGPVRVTWLVNAAGLYSDEFDALLGHHDFTVTPRKGELIVFDKLARALVRHIVLPVPTSRGKGSLSPRRSSATCCSGRLPRTSTTRPTRPRPRLGSPR